MDNATGHGSNKAKDRYENRLNEKCNIEIVWQVSNLPEMNMLDLGAWMCIQSYVEYLHRMKTMKQNALSKSVKKVFKLFDGDEKLMNISNRWKKVLKLIIVGNRWSNELVKKCCELKAPPNNLPSFPDENWGELGGCSSSEE
jgi:hypothetical protein